MRWMIRFGFGLAIVVLLALGLLALVPSERVAAAVSARFESLTGRRMVLEGEVKPRIWPTLGVTTGPVSIANAEWATTDTPLFRAESLSIDVNLGALFGGEVKVTGLAAEAPAINLERAEDGRENWVFGGSLDGGESAAPAPATGFTLDEGMVRDGSIRFADRQSGSEIALDGVNATLSVPDYAGPFTLVATGLSGGQPVTLDMGGGVFSAFAAGSVVPLTVKLTVGGSTIDFDGRGGLSPLLAEGALGADLADLPALGTLAGVALSQPGPGLGQKQLSLSGQLTLDNTGAAFLRGADIIADSNRVSGDLDLRPGESRPKLLGQLTAGPVTIGTGPTNGGGTGGGMQAESWPAEVIDVSGLGALDMELSLTAPSVDLGVLRLGETQALITVERARAVIDLRQVAAYGGRIAGDFVVNGRGGLSVGGRLSFIGLETQPLFTDLAGWDRLVSTADLEVEFLGVGNSIAEIMAGLSGQGAVEMGQGELRGLDISGMLRTLDPGFVGEGQKTIFDGLAGTFSITEGVLRNEDLKLVAPYLTAAGSGEVGLGDRTLNYRIRPTALAGEDGTGGVMVPLQITGPWADPTFRLDLESIAREKMEAEAKAVEERLKAEAQEAEARAKAELEQRLQDELGIEIAPDESLGDAAQRGLEEALEDEARKALEDILSGD